VRSAINFGLFVLLAFLLPAVARAEQMLPNQFPAVVKRLQPVDRLPPATRLNLAIGLPVRNRAELTQLLHDLYDPASPRFHQYLTAEQFTERFGPSARDYNAVVEFAQTNGLTVKGAPPNRMVVALTGTAAAIEKALHTHLRVYQHPTEPRTFYSPDGDPTLDLAVPVLGISGLDNFILPHPMNIQTNNPTAYTTGSGPSGFFIGNDFRAAYAPGVALDGTGQAVGLFELDGYYPQDITQYQSLARLPNVSLTNVLLDGFSGTPGADNIEVALDIEMAICMAPGLARVIVYEGLTPNDILNRMAADNQARQLSSSWGFGPQTDPVREQIFEEFAAQGQTMFQASGDSGAYNGAVSPPSDDPNLTIVGGTSLTTSNAGGAWASETTWFGSGGGISEVFPIPTWQQGVSMTASKGSTTQRNIPDVACVADVSIWLVANNGQQGPIGGTSAATPLWAGFTALINQQAAANGRPSVGFLNPGLYSLGASAAFHDITTGNNTNNVSPTNFFAVAGYDLCTGWGTPSGSNLITALVSPPDALQISPQTNLMASGPPGGPFDPLSQTFLLTNTGTTSLHWTLTDSATWLTPQPTNGILSAGGPSTTVTVNLNPSANTLPAGSYIATLWFTNLTDGFGQTRQFTLDVLGPPVVTSQPISQTAPPAATVAFIVEAIGNAPLSYQWQLDGTNLADGNTFSGSLTSNLMVSDISLSDAGTYTVIVTNTLGSVTSAPAILSVVSFTAPGVTFSNLYSFTGNADGGNPNGLIQETNGDFYGTTQDGGTNSAGTLFQMTPAGLVTTLNTFGSTGNSGAFPSSELVQGEDGNLYGTTESGGTSQDWGTIFRTTTNGDLTSLVLFNGANGGFPYRKMIQGTDGNFYGTTLAGGGDGDGTVFQMTPNGTLTTLASFNYVDGFDPNELAEGIDGNFYGTTFEGGSNGDGSIYKISTNGVLTNLVSFNYTNGGFLPYSGLFETANGDFFGTTYEGGTNGQGTLFKMSLAGQVTSLYSFTGGDDGGHPAAPLLQGKDGNFYGTTATGGTYGNGTAFRMTPNGAVTTLAEFDGYDGANPQAGLVQGMDGNLYGTTENGGADDMGVIFRISITSPSLQITAQPADQSAFVGATAVFSVAVLGNPALSYQWQENGASLPGATNRILTLTNVAPESAGYYSVLVSNNQGSILSDDAFLEVTISPPQITTPPQSQNRSLGSAAMFPVTATGDLPMSWQWQKNGTNLMDGGQFSGSATSTLTISNLTEANDGTYAVIVSNNIGAVTSSGAVLEVFPISAAGTSLLPLHWFTGGRDGGVPNGLALGPDGILYGTTQNGGAYKNGTIFSLTTNGTFTTLVSFDETNGATPLDSLTPASNGDLYGTTEYGGSNFSGTIFSVTPAGLCDVLYSFISNSDSTLPYTSLTADAEGNFYGSATDIHATGLGNIFKTAPDGSVNNVYSFTGGMDGNSPVGALTLGTDGNFYGMTSGGANGYGNVFKMSPSGVLTNLYSFTGGTDGRVPAGQLVQGTDGNFYGVTKRNVIDGFSFYGTIFKITPTGVLTTLYSLDFTDGAYPFAGLIQASDGNFYGTTYTGVSSINGTLFRITPGGALTTLVSFNGSDDGAYPESALVQGADGNLYGTTTTGGTGGQGTVFRLTFTSAPQIVTQPVNQTAVAGESVSFYVTVFGAMPLSYQWQENGTNVNSGTNRVLTLVGVTPGEAGTYSVIVSNALGTATSVGAVLSVIVPPLFQSAIQADGMLTLTWSATVGQIYQVQYTTNLNNKSWIDLGTSVTAASSTVSASDNIVPDSQRFYRIALLP
jgi:uncharacterized repeat protein (TIGR03803 family)